MQHRIKTPGPLLKPDGSLREPGYATSLLLDYQRAAVRTSALRIKEWDYYLILNDRYAVALTIADNGYMGLDSVSFMDFSEPWQQTVSRMRLLPLGKTGLPASSARGDVSSAGRGYHISFENDGNVRTLRFRMPRFRGQNSISGTFVLMDAPEDSMVIATPFPKRRKAFYYNQKINCLRARGEVKLGGRVYPFSPADSFATLDWGRGVWTYSNTWYWGSCSGLVEGVPFGFNLGYGFGDTRAASENMLFYDGRAHKLAGIDFGIPQSGGRDAFMRPWHITSTDGRLTLTFEPVIDRASRTSVGVIYSDQHQVFGRFTGEAVLDDGSVLYLDRIMGFAEKVSNKW